jgi:hypothetical protein
VIHANSVLQLQYNEAILSIQRTSHTLRGSYFKIIETHYPILPKQRGAGMSASVRVSPRHGRSCAVYEIGSSPFVDDHAYHHPILAWLHGASRSDETHEAMRHDCIGCAARAKLPTPFYKKASRSAPPSARFPRPVSSVVTVARAVGVEAQRSRVVPRTRERIVSAGRPDCACRLQRWSIRDRHIRTDMRVPTPPWSFSLPASVDKAIPILVYLVRYPCMVHAREHLWTLVANA